MPGEFRPTLGAAVNVELDIDALSRLGRLLLGRGELGGRRFLRPEVVAALEQPVVEYLPAFTAGGLRLESHHGRKWFTSAGAYPGYIARLAYSPATGQGYAVLVNSELSPARLGELENFLRGQIGRQIGHQVGRQVGESIRGQLPPARESVQAVSTAELPVYWKQRLDTPLERFFGSWLNVAYARPAGTQLHWQPLLEAGSEWSLSAGGLLRKAGDWWPAMQWKAGVLSSADQQWYPVPAWKYYGGLMLGLLLSCGWLATMLYAATWIVASFKGHVHGYHEWLPRLLPLLANLVLLAFVVLLGSLDIPAIGQAVPLTYALLLVSILQPLLAVLSLPAALAGVRWKLPWPGNFLNIAATLTALLCAGWIIACDLLAFQAWKY